MFRIVIPARYASSRLPGKPLLELAGKPLLQWVHERALGCGALEVSVATDDQRIAEVARGFGAQVVMTAAHHETGTDRIAEVARLAGWPADAVVVNLQGDEPLMPAQLVRQVAALLARHGSADIATLAAALDNVSALLDPNVVKVVTTPQGRALYFSRAPIPWDRDAAPQGLISQTSAAGARRHIGLYAYTVGFLKKYCAWPASELESIEALEQLRILWHGEKILVQTVEKAPIAGVDTLEDLQRVETIMKKQAH
jgi:3-deoxy-manno-octulosonate cytidylyltransferase (CMP-KDO synthetase)